jgi:N-acyl-L-homoserine lactone synthetase
MKTLCRIKFKLKDGNYFVDFGIPTTPEEFEEMFKLRYEVYIKEKGYGNQNYFPEEKEYDKYDVEKKCYYAIATFNKKVIGTARLVRNNSLPLEEEYFSLNEPESVKKIPRKYWAELSRLISKPPFAFPPYLIMMGLFYTLLRYGFKYDLRIGFAVITEDLRKKIQKLRIPFYEIREYSSKTSEITQKFQGYFQRRKLSLIYFFRDEINKYLNDVIKKKLISKYFKTEITLTNFPF